MSRKGLDLKYLQTWTERPPTVLRETISLRSARTLAAILDRETELAMGDALPPLWHWIYFAPVPKAGDIGDDGHQRRGKFLPPVPLRRRMWAASNCQFVGSLRVGQDVEKSSRVTKVVAKQGRAGQLVFVTVSHRYSVEGAEKLREQQTMVYTSAPNEPDAAGEGIGLTADWSTEVIPDSVLLFRYSAITANTHRIHFDRDYAVQKEGYVGLVVHSPLTATLMLESLLQNSVGIRLAEFRFRALRPLLDTGGFRISGCRQENEVKLWASGPTGEVAVEAIAILKV